MAVSDAELVDAVVKELPGISEGVEFGVVKLLVGSASLLPVVRVESGPSVMTLGSLSSLPSPSNP